MGKKEVKKDEMSGTESQRLIGSCWCTEGAKESKGWTVRVKEPLAVVKKAAVSSFGLLW